MARKARKLVHGEGKVMDGVKYVWNAIKHIFERDNGMSSFRQHISKVLPKMTPGSFDSFTEALKRVGYGKGVHKWKSHVKDFHGKNKHLTFKEALRQASGTYRK